MKRLAIGISILFHPLFITTYSAVLFYLMPALAQPFRPSVWLVGAVFIVTFLIPFICLALLHLLGRIDSFTVNIRSQRMLPLAFLSLVYIIATFILHEYAPASNLTKFVALLSVLVVCATLITSVYKISLHSFASWSAAGVLLPLGPLTEGSIFLFLIILLVVLASLTVVARLVLKAHTPKEVFIGGAIGLIVGYSGSETLFG